MNKLLVILLIVTALACSCRRMSDEDSPIRDAYTGSPFLREIEYKGHAYIFADYAVGEKTLIHAAHCPCKQEK